MLTSRSQIWYTIFVGPFGAAADKLRHCQPARGSRERCKLHSGVRGGALVAWRFSCVLVTNLRQSSNVVSWHLNCFSSCVIWLVGSSNSPLQTPHDTPLLNYWLRWEYSQVALLLQRPRDASCLFFIACYIGYRFITAHTNAVLLSLA